MNRLARHSFRSGFSLIELLVVVAIVALLSVLVVPALNSVVDAGRINRAANQVLTTFSVAAQRASSENRAVGIRLLRESEDSEWRHLQVVGFLPDDTVEPLDRLTSLPEGVAIASSPQLSSFFSLPQQTSSASDPPISHFGASYQFIEFQFRPDGRLNQDVTRKWFLTVLPGEPKGDPAATAVPGNYATIQVDPVNGSTRLYRP